MTSCYTPLVLLFLFAVLGVVIGSFGNVLISRVPRGMPITGRSRCPTCSRTIRPLELIPVISFIFLGGRCRGCGERISIQYPLVEITSGALFTLALVVSGFEPIAGFALAIALWALLLIAVIDAGTQTIPDALTLVVLLASLAWSYSSTGDIPILSPTIGVVFFGAQWLASRGAWIGSGDILLAGALGFLFPRWEHMVVTLLVAYILGGAFAAYLLARRTHGRQSTIAFGPFLAVAACGVVLLEPWASYLIP